MRIQFNIKTGGTVTGAIAELFSVLDTGTCANAHITGVSVLGTYKPTRYALSGGVLYFELANGAVLALYTNATYFGIREYRNFNWSTYAGDAEGTIDIQTTYATTTYAADQRCLTASNAVDYVVNFHPKHFVIMGNRMSDTSSAAPGYGNALLCAVPCQDNVKRFDGLSTCKTVLWGLNTVSNPNFAPFNMRHYSLGGGITVNRHCAIDEPSIQSGTVLDADGTPLMAVRPLLVYAPGGVLTAHGDSIFWVGGATGFAARLDYGGRVYAAVNGRSYVNCYGSENQNAYITKNTLVTEVL